MQKAVEILSNRNLKATTNRVKLLELIQSNQSATSFAQIQEKFKSNDRITLYRTIQTLLNSGVIHQANYGKQETYYALCGSSCSAKSHNHEHIHFKCEQCNEVTCQEITPNLTISIPEFKINSVQINATGICPNCIVNDVN